MAIFRNSNRENYVVISSETIRDLRLKNKDIGALVRLLALPDFWDFSVEGLIKGKVMCDGRTAIDASLHRLEEYGYLQRTQSRDVRNRFGGYEWEIYERPKLRDSPFLGNLKTEKPKTKKAKSENNKQSITYPSIIYQSINECVGSLSQEDYAVLCARYGTNAVDYQIQRIIEGHYKGCMNAKIIGEWCEERKKRTSAPNKFNKFKQNNYDFEELEKELLSN